MKTPSPSAIIGQRDAQTGDARATRARQLATPSWLSTRPKPVIHRRATPACAARETVAKNSVINIMNVPEIRLARISRDPGAVLDGAPEVWSTVPRLGFVREFAAVWRAEASRSPTAGRGTCTASPSPT